MALSKCGGFLLFASFVFFSCQSRIPDASQGSQTAPYNTWGQDQGAPGSDHPRDRRNLVGLVGCGEGQEETFYIQVAQFIAARTDPNPLIESQRIAINCRNRRDLKGGMIIRGSLVFDEGQLFDPEGDNSGLMVSAEESYLEIFILNLKEESLISGDQSANGAAGQGIRLDYLDDSSFASSFGDSSSIELTFHNYYRTVTLSGSIDESGGKWLFSGEFSYQNKKHFSGAGQLYGGVLGRFKIPACSLFACSP